MPRPERPGLNSRGRQARVRDADQMSAEGEVLKRGRIIKCRAFGAPTLEILIPALRPGLLTDGPTGLDGGNQRRGRSKTLSVKCVPQSALCGASQSDLGVADYSGLRYGVSLTAACGAARVSRRVEIDNSTFCLHEQIPSAPSRSRL